MGSTGRRARGGGTGRGGCTGRGCWLGRPAGVCKQRPLDTGSATPGGRPIQARGQGFPVPSGRGQWVLESRRAQPGAGGPAGAPLGEFTLQDAQGVASGGQSRSPQATGRAFPGADSPALAATWVQRDVRPQGRPVASLTASGNPVLTLTRGIGGFQARRWQPRICSGVETCRSFSEVEPKASR